MKVCIPVEGYRGLKSVVSGHFGGAPAFTVVDTETLAVTPVSNEHEHHQHGQCSPLRTIAGRQVNAVLAVGIGGGAIRGLQAAGIEVFQCRGGTVADVVQQFNACELPAMGIDQACAGHGSDHECHSH